jgi:hypothetical protein
MRRRNGLQLRSAKPSLEARWITLREPNTATEDVADCREPGSARLVSVWKHLTDWIPWCHESHVNRRASASLYRKAVKSLFRYYL